LSNTLYAPTTPEKVTFSPLSGITWYLDRAGKPKQTRSFFL
jgi:hypothetical protein